MKANKVLLSIFIIFLYKLSFSQDFLGFSNSNYAGNYGIALQPASIVDSRIKFELNLAGFDLGIGNNFLGLKAKEFFGRQDITLLDGDLSIDDTTVNFIDDYVEQLANNSNKKIFFGLNILGPSMMFSFKNGHSFALTTRLRTSLQVAGITDNFSDIMWDWIGAGEVDPNVQLNGDGFNVQGVSWGEFGLTYGAVLLNKEDKFLKAAFTAKYIRGIGAFYFYADQLNFRIPNDTTLDFASANFSYGHSANLTFDNGTNISGRTGYVPTFGFDLGLVYEYRPKYDEFFYFMNNDPNNVRHDLNKYKYRAGLSITDLGSIKFNKGLLTHDFNITSQQFLFSSFDSVSTIQGYDTVIRNEFQTTVPPDIIQMSLPTALGLQFDYNVVGRLYLGMNAVIGFKPKKLGVQQLTRISITPRWEQSMFEAGIPISYNGYGQFNFGAYIRLTPLIILGTNDLLGTLFSGTLQSGTNFYAGVKIPFHKKMLKDSDKDLVSNKFDECKKVPGTWERQGCPEPEEPEDKDGDGIVDAEDDCPEEPGEKELKGCPDNDHDGVADKDDLCPEDSGLIVFSGCPDTDNDSVPDMRDSCPDIAGLIALYGCPEKEIEEDTTPPQPEIIAIDCFEGMDDAEAYIYAVKKYGKEKVDGLKFKVQIGAYTNPPGASHYSFLKNVGPIDKKVEDGLTKYKVGDMETLEQTEILKQNVINQGVKDAFVNAYYNGDKIPLRRAIEMLCGKKQ